MRKRVLLFRYHGYGWVVLVEKSVENHSFKHKSWGVVIKRKIAFSTVCRAKNKNVRKKRFLILTLLRSASKLAKKIHYIGHGTQLWSWIGVEVSSALPRAEELGCHPFDCARKTTLPDLKFEIARRTLKCYENWLHIMQDSVLSNPFLCVVLKLWPPFPRPIPPCLTAFQTLDGHTKVPSREEYATPDQITSLYYLVVGQHFQLNNTE